MGAVGTYILESIQSRRLEANKRRLVSLLVFCNFYFGLLSVVAPVLVMVLVSVDSNVLFAARTAFTILFTIGDLFLVESSTTILVTWKRCGERGVLGFVTFPSDALVSLSFYSDLGSCFFSSGVVPVRRRKDAERNRDSGVKVQIAGEGGAWSRMPFEPLRERIERKTRVDPCFEEGGGEKGVLTSS